MHSHSSHDSGQLTRGDGTTLYWESSGSRLGLPALYLHGGPGAGCATGYRKHFDPDLHYVISLDQRGCGRSRPLATESDLATHTTQALIGDLEALREHLRLPSWLVVGTSWGTTLALAYAQAHPDRVTGLALAAVCTTSRAEVAWATEHIGCVFPREWEAFAAVPRAPGTPLVDAYAEALANPALRDQAARAWCTWEDVHVSLNPGHKPFLSTWPLDRQRLFATLVTHYWRHAAFLEDGALLRGMTRIAHLPGALLHGRLDVSSPLQTAWQLHRAWPGSTLEVIEDEGHGGPAMAASLTAAIARLSSPRA